MPIKRKVSTRAGTVLDAEGRPKLAYRACQDIPCALCGAIIPTGTIFARRAVYIGYTVALPHCRKCLPLESSAR